MGHEIARNDIVIATKRTWHTLEHLVREGLTPTEAARKALPWEPESIEVIGLLPNGEVILAPDFKMMVRDDDKSVLGIVSSGYKEVRNQVFAEFGEALVSADQSVRIKTMGSLRGGKRVFMCAKIGGFEAERGDSVESYLTLTNAHDGTGAFRVYFSTVRIVCANTFRYSQSKAGNAGFWFRHDGDVTAKIHEARKALGMVHRMQDEASSDARRMAATDVTQTEVANYFSAVYEETFGKKPGSTATTKKEQQAIGAKMLADALASDSDILSDAILQYDRKRDQAIGQWNQNHNNDPASGTVWGAMNAVTEYHDHQRGRGEPQERTMTDARVHSNIFGASANDKQIAYKHALARV